MRTVVTCFVSDRTIDIALALAKPIQHTVRLGLPWIANPNAVLAILLSACLHSEGKAFGARNAAPQWFPDFKLNRVVARVARSCGRKKGFYNMV